MSMSQRTAIERHALSARNIGWWLSLVLGCFKQKSSFNKFAARYYSWTSINFETFAILKYMAYGKPKNVKGKARYKTKLGRSCLCDISSVFSLCESNSWKSKESLAQRDLDLNTLVANMPRFRASKANGILSSKLGSALSSSCISHSEITRALKPFAFRKNP